MNIKNNKPDLLVICYPNDWHWVLSLEYLLIKANKSRQIHVLDLSQVGEVYLKHIVKSIFQKNSLQKQFYKICKATRLNYKKRKTFLYLLEYIFFYVRYLLLSKTNDLRVSPSYNSIVEKIGSLEFKFNEYKNVIIQEEFQASAVVKKLNRIDLSHYQKIITVNGRFTKNAAVIKYAKTEGCQTELIEFGSSRTTISIYSVSPHSMNEVQDKINNYWTNSSSHYREAVASQFIEKIKADQDIYKVGWRNKMQPGRVPPKVNKFRCTFFASTESEYAGVGDPIESKNFQNQSESFLSLCTVLSPDNWEIYLRRHPKNPNSRIEDPEKNLWTLAKTFSHVMIVPPESSIDSLELGLSSDMIVNFNSFIAMELIVHGSKKVITTGPAPWNLILPRQYTPDVASLKSYCESPIPIESVTDIWPWAFYTASHGENFSKCSWNNHKQNWEII